MPAQIPIDQVFFAILNTAVIFLGIGLYIGYRMRKEDDRLSGLTKLADLVRHKVEQKP